MGMVSAAGRAYASEPEHHQGASQALPMTSEVRPGAESATTRLTGRLRSSSVASQW